MQERKTTDLWGLKQFLTNPLEYRVCRTLGIKNYEDSGDTAAANEPLDSGYKIFALRKKAWTAVLSMIFSNEADKAVDGNAEAHIAEKAADVANKIYDEHIKSGQAPEGHICRMEREELIRWTAACAVAAPAIGACFPNHQFVENYEFSLFCGDFVINISLPFTIIPKEPENQHHKIGVIAFDKRGKSGDNLKLWLDGAAVWLNEIKKCGNHHPVVLTALNHGDKPTLQVLPMNMNPYKRQDMERWLIGVLTQMLIDNRCEHLPFAAIADILKPDKKGAESYEARLQRLTARSLADYLAKNGYTAYTKAFELTDAKQPETGDDDLRLLAGSRYAPILERWIHE
jgi:hypothetical protein